MPFEEVSDKFKLQVGLNETSADRTFEDVPHDKVPSYKTKKKYLPGKAHEMTGIIIPGSPNKYAFGIGYAEALLQRSSFGGNQDQEDPYEKSAQSRELSELKYCSFVEDGDKINERKLSRFKQFLYQQALQGLTNE